MPVPEGSVVLVILPASSYEYVVEFEFQSVTDSCKVRVAAATYSPTHRYSRNRIFPARSNRTPSASSRCRWKSTAGPRLP